MPKLAVSTETGSVYILDREQMTWEKTKHIPAITAIAPMPVRTKGGPLIKWPEIHIGQPMILLGPPITEGTDGRAITTSYVIGVEEISE